MLRWARVVAGMCCNTLVLVIGTEEVINGSNGVEAGSK